jgi:hypothetical protein
MPTVTDGFLESLEMRRRIGAYARALYASDELALVELCRRYAVRFVWIPGRRRQMFARYAEVDFREYFAASLPTPRGRRTNFARLLHEPDALRCFKPVAAIDRDRIYEFVLGDDCRRR